MIRVALKGLAARRLRTALTALAIVVGRRHGERGVHAVRHDAQGRRPLSAAAYDGTDAVVTRQDRLRAAPSTATRRARRSPPRRSTQVRALPEVGRRRRRHHRHRDPRSSAPTASPSATARTSASASTPRTQGVEQAQPVPPRRRALGHRPGPGRHRRRHRRQAAPARSATRSRIAARARRALPRRRHRALRRRQVDRHGDGRGVRPAARRSACSASAGALDRILVAGRPGVERREVRRALAAALPATLQVQTAADHDRFTLDGLNEFVDIIGIVLLVFAGVAILVGAFTIFNTLSITVAQRSRELGLLRMVGAARRQVLGSVLVEALAIGVLASAVGLAAGLGLAKGLNAVLVGAGPRPAADRHGVRDAHDRGRRALVGTVVTMLAASSRPGGRRASRRSPRCATASADGARAGPGRPRRPRRHRAARPPGRRRLGGSAGRLARRNAMRNPGRVGGRPRSALTIGVALVTAVSVLAPGPEGHDDRLAGATACPPTHVVVDKDGWSPIDRLGRARRRGAPRASARVSGVRQDGALAFGDDEGVNGVDPATVGRVLDFDWKPGDRVGPGRPGPRRRDRRRGLGQGAPPDRWATAFTITSAAGTQLALRVEGIEKSPVIDVARASARSRSRAGRSTRRACATSARGSRSSTPRRRRAPALDRGAAPAIPDVEVPDDGAFIDDAGQGDRPAAGHLLRAAGAGRDRVPVRHRQHARALDLRAHAASSACCGPSA